MQVVRLTLTWIILAFLICGCSLHISSDESKIELVPTNNAGGYNFELDDDKLNQEGDSVYIYGKILDVIKNEPLPSSFIHWFCDQSISDEYGNYSLWVKYQTSLPNRFLARSIGYKSIQTQDWDFQNIDSLRLDFYLDVHDEVMTHCD